MEVVVRDSCFLDARFHCYRTSTPNDVLELEIEAAHMLRRDPVKLQGRV